MKREQQTNSAEDVLANVGDSLREWAPSRDEERGALDRVWTGLRWKAKQVPAEVLRSVELGPALSERRRVEGPQPARWNRRSTVWVAAAAAMVIVAVGGAMVWPRGARVYAAGKDGLQVTLADDSRVEMRAHAEMTVDRASDGIRIDLKKGDIIVSAAEQRDGHLYVQTKDVTVTVVGTVFLVNAGEGGSRVAVIEGEVLVREARGKTTLRPGEQVSTSAVLAARQVRDDIIWSRNADVHLAILDSFTKGMAQTAGSLVPMNSGQTAAPAGPEFEEASVRECDLDNVPAPPPGARGGGPNSFLMTPGRTYVLCMTLATIIRTAYDYAPADIYNPLGRRSATEPPRRFDRVGGLGVENGLRVRGGPDWVREQRYTIEAVAAKASDPETMSGPMLRALLAARFGLKAHIETEQMAAVALTLAPGGLKIKEGACTPDPSYAPPGGAVQGIVDLVQRNLDAARRGATTPGPCGMGGAMNGANLIYVAAGAGLPPVRSIVGAPVINRTGIPDTARFNYVLEFAPDHTTQVVWPMNERFQIAANPSAVPPAPSFATALEQQIGLRLEPAQTPREYIVIDAIRRPGPN